MTTPPATRPASATVSLADEERARCILTDALSGVRAAVCNRTRPRPSKRMRYRVPIFGTVLTQPGHWVSQGVKDMAVALDRAGAAPRHCLARVVRHAHGADHFPVKARRVAVCEAH